MTKFSLKDRPYIELCDLLKIMGFCSSGGVAKHLITNGEVTVDGNIEYRKRCKIHADQVITLNEHQVVVTK